MNGADQERRDETREVLVRLELPGEDEGGGRLRGPMRALRLEANQPGGNAPPGLRTGPAGRQPGEAGRPGWPELHVPANPFRKHGPPSGHVPLDVDPPSGDPANPDGTSGEGLEPSQIGTITVTTTTVAPGASFPLGLWATTSDRYDIVLDAPGATTAVAFRLVLQTTPAPVQSEEHFGGARGSLWTIPPVIAGDPAVRYFSEPGNGLTKWRIDLDAQDVDLALIYGIGFPPFRWGLLFWTDAIGAAAIVEKLKAYQPLGARFAAPAFAPTSPRRTRPSAHAMSSTSRNGSRSRPAWERRCCASSPAIIPMVTPGTTSPRGWRRT